MPRWITAVLLACFGCFNPAIGAYGQTPTHRIDIDLQKYGWTPLPPFQRGVGYFVASPLRHHLAFDHQGRIVIGLTTVGRPRAAASDQPVLNFNVFRLDNTGHQDLSFVLPTNDWRGNLILVTDIDQIIIRANDQLKIMASDPAASSGTMQIQTAIECVSGCSIFQSSSRRTILLLTHYSSHQEKVVLIKSGTAPLTSIYSPSETFAADSITDSYGYVLGKLGRTRKETLYRWPLTDHTEPLAVEAALQGYGTAINDSEVVVSGWKDFGAIDTGGQLRFKKRLAKLEETSDFLRSSEDGERFALAVFTYKGNSKHGWDSHLAAQRVVVYDSKTGDELATVDAQTTRYQFDFSLSPDGHHVAILADNVLTLADIR
jgi:hypothetical protein